MYYTVEWRNTLTTGDWHSVYEQFRDVQSQDGTITREIPTFFRVRAYPVPEFVRYLTATSRVMAAGYYAEDVDLSEVDPNLAAGNIRDGVSIFGMAGTVVEAGGNADPAQVLEGATFSTAGAAGLTGAMPNRGAQNVAPGTAAQVILPGYHDGSGEVAGDAALTSANIRGGATIFGVDGKPEVVDTEDATAVAADVMEGKIAFVAGSAVTGTIATVTLSDTTTVVQAGYIAATNLALVDADLAAGNIRGGVTLFGVPGTVLQATGDATAAAVLTGSTFSRVDAVDVAGIMPDRGAQNIIPTTESQLISHGYHNGTGTVAGDADLTVGNIKAEVNIFGVIGTAVEATGNADPAQVLEGATFSKAGEAGLTGTMANRGSQSITPGTTIQTILQGYHDGTGEVAGDANLIAGNIKAGTEIFGVSGKIEVVDTEDADAAPGHILKDRTAYVGGSKVTGTIETRMLSSDSDTVAAGYYTATTLRSVDADLASGNVRSGVTLFGIEGNSNVVDTSSGTATVGDLVFGKRAWIAGVEITGTRPENATVIRTGQSASYRSGDDGAWQRGTAWPVPRFVVVTNAGDVVVQDNLTKLVWTLNANITGGGTNWNDAIDFCNSLDFAEFEHWRLPNARELQSLIDFSQNFPALPAGHLFTNVQSGHYWTSTTHATDDQQAYYVNSDDGNMQHSSKAVAGYVWPVRDVQFVPLDMAVIPAGYFEKTDHPDGTQSGVTYIDEFYISRTHITKAQWDEVRDWAILQGYTEMDFGAGKGPDHPVHSVNWYSAVKWCNARSEMEGLTPAYYTDSAQTNVYRGGNINITNDRVKWTTGGYRLPTEAEWEKAARGGVQRQRFPWGDTISHEQANFNNDGGEAYQYGTTGYHPDYTNAPMPYTSPVGSFAPNGYGLYDMAGNVYDWCWDRSATSGYYWNGTNPRGPNSGSYRMFRGGSWAYSAFRCRSAYRGSIAPGGGLSDRGFRVAMPSADAP